MGSVFALLVFLATLLPLVPLKFNGAANSIPAHSATHHSPPCRAEVHVGESLATFPLTHTYLYNSQNRLTDLSVTRSSTTFKTYRYALGEAGNRLSETELQITPHRTATYAYDNLYRLKSETIANDDATIPANGDIVYGHDVVGNRLNRTVSGSTLSGQVPTVNNVSYDGRDLPNNETFDSNGNTTTTSDTYDFENHLITRGNISIKYDGDGNRMSKTVGSTTIYYVVDDRNPTGYAQVLEEIVGGAPTVLYTYGHSLISQNRSGTAKFYGFDGHNSVRILVDSSGTWTDAYTYDAFGILINAVGSTPNNYLYCGEQMDLDLGLYYLRARYMNPGTGRFWTMDTFEGQSEDPLSLHKYLYAQSDPINRLDPSGRMSWEQFLGYDAEEAIQAEYLATHVAPPGMIQFGTRFHYTLLDYLKPDIQNHFEKKFLEIKPISPSGIAKGAAKIIKDTAFFGPIGYSADTAWAPRSLLITPDGNTIFVHNVGGVIYYQDLELLEYKALAAGVALTAKDLLGLLSPRALAPALARIGRLAITAKSADNARLYQHIGIASLLALGGAF